ncbi:ABC transporter substrate-binding protein [Nonomuraea jabiensis]|uniref:ABC transporter substrate-binding protein n=1 Tax=Nonomuraea jabiensis TaxID=882448 RepID=UPI003414C173
MGRSSSTGTSRDRRSTNAATPPTSGRPPSLALQTSLNSGTSYSYYFNTSHAPFDDQRVREAFREAVDVDAVLKSVYQGTATRAWSIVGQKSPFYDATLEGGYGGDVAKANALLDAAGWKGRDAEGFRVKGGKRLTVREVASAPFVRDRRDILAQAIQEQVKQSAGIDFQVKIVDQGSAPPRRRGRRRTGRPPRAGARRSSGAAATGPRTTTVRCASGCSAPGYTGCPVPIPAPRTATCDLKGRRVAEAESDGCRGRPRPLFDPVPEGTGPDEDLQWSSWCDLREQSCGVT